MTRRPGGFSFRFSFLSTLFVVCATALVAACGTSGNSGSGGGGGGGGGSGATAPTISAQPQSASTAKGMTVTFSVTAAGTAPLTYQWYKNGAAISGATSSSYTTPAAAAADSGAAFTVIVNNAANAPVTSSPAVLIVTHTLALLAGAVGGVGHTDGQGSSATFYNPVATATDANGNIYVADQFNHLIRMITPAGAVSTVAGTAGVSGSADGTGTAAQFNSPSGIAFDATTGDLYVADTNNNTIRKIALPGAVVTTVAGTVGVSGAADGTGTAAQFWAPNGLGVDSAGNVYVADTYNDTIRKIALGAVVTTLAGSHRLAGAVDGTGAAARFYAPTGVAVDALSGNIYVVDYLNCTIRQVTPAGVVTTIAGKIRGYGFADGTGTAAIFNGPLGATIDATGTSLYVADTHNRIIRRVTLPGGVVTTIAGTAGVSGHADGSGATAQFAYPAALAIDAGNNLYVADSDNNLIRKITTPGALVTTLAGSVGGHGYADGTGGVAGTARFDDPHNVVSDSSGNVFVADMGNEVIRKIAPSGAVTTFVGTAGVTGSANGTGPTAHFNSPFGMVFDSHGNLYVADSGNNTIRMVTTAGVVSTFAGTAGVTGSADGTGAAAQFSTPYALGIDSSDTLFLTDYGNNTVRKITTPGAVVTTLAGTAGVSGSTDATGPAAQFWGPHGLAVNASTGNIYVADRFNETIRMITPAGVVTTIAGTPGKDDFVDGTGSAAHFSWPAAIAIDHATGNLYVADYLHNAVRMIAAGNVVTTVVGTPGTSNVVLGDLPGGLSGPSSVAIVPGPALELAISDAVENSVLLATLP